MLFSAMYMLIHGVASDDMYSCTLIPIPKGKNVNVTAPSITVTDPVIGVSK